MLFTAVLGILVAMGMALARAFLGPTIYDRILAVNLFGTKTVLLISILSYLAGRSDLLDIALIYALINFLGVVAVLHYFEYNDKPDTPAKMQDKS